MLKIKINQWQEILKKDIQEIDSIYSKPKQEKLGVQESHNSNPIESMLIRVEDQKKKIQSWIDESNKKIIKYEQDKKIVEIMLDSLDEESHYIITQKHLEKKKWNIITYQFNNKYRNEYHEYITVSGIRKKYSSTKKQLFEQFGELLQKN